MLTTIDHIVSLLSSTAIGTSAVMLAIIHVPDKIRWEPLSHARWILVATFSILAFSGLFKIDEESNDWIGLVTLFVASYQALLFTQTASVMLTRSKTFRNTLWAFGIITLLTCLLVVTKIYAQHIFSLIWYPAVAAYFVQLVVHTMVFRRQVKKTEAELEDYYDENVDYHLNPIKKFFYSALGIGILAGTVSLVPLVPLHHWCYNAFVILYTVYYTYVVVALMNYCIDGDFFLAAAEEFDDKSEKVTFTLPAPEIETEEKPEEITPEELEAALSDWVMRKEFTRIDVSTNQVAEELHITRQQLVAYFKAYHNTTFRSWRHQLRLEYAKTLIRDCKDLQLSHLHEQVGFNDRSNFHTSFRKYTGLTPQEFKDKV